MMLNSKLAFIFCGLPSSGKTTLSNNLFSIIDNVKLISSLQLREKFKLFDSHSQTEREKLQSKIKESIPQFKDSNLIIDTNLFNEDLRSNIIDCLVSCGYKICLTFLYAKNYDLIKRINSKHINNTIFKGKGLTANDIINYVKVNFQSISRKELNLLDYYSVIDTSNNLITLYGKDNQLNNLFSEIFPNFNLSYKKHEFFKINEDDFNKSYIGSLRAYIGNQKIISPSIRAVILKDNSVLLVKRVENNCWQLPSGAMELEESITDCLEREILEETGLIVLEYKLVSIFSSKNYSYYNIFGEEYQMLSFVFLVSKVEGEIKIDDKENSDYKFFELDNLPELTKHHLESISDATKNSDKIIYR